VKSRVNKVYNYRIQRAKKALTAYSNYQSLNALNNQ